MNFYADERQATSDVLMIRPANFMYNKETAESNVFQIKGLESTDLQHKALKEFDELVKTLGDHHIRVTVIGDSIESNTPDSIFPNNWVSFHSDGTVYLYPMQAVNRRAERRPEIIKALKKQYQLLKIKDFSYLENQKQYLEGTGSMVFDRKNRIAYACISPRTSPDSLRIFCEQSKYRAHVFHAVDIKGTPIYHTNVMMCVGAQFAVVCLDCITNQAERKHLVKSLTSNGKEVVAISLQQMYQFAGNMLELKNTRGESLLAMSERAFCSLEEEQINVFQKYVEIIHAPLYHIEDTGGGSARCMMAEVYLPRL